MKKLLLVVIFFILGSVIVFASGTLNQDSSALTSKLQSILDDAIADSKTPGAVLLISSPKTGTIVVASGYSDEENETPMTINNNFRLASMSKSFLAVAMLKLIEQGKLNLDDKLENLLPDNIVVSRIPNGDKVTIHQLLHMRSGIPNYLSNPVYDEKVENDPNHVWVPEDGIKLVYDDEVKFAPDSSYDYSNTNYILLQAVIEHLTDEPIAKLFHKDIFNPLHMNNTYVEVQDDKSSGVFHGLTTHGYRLNDDKKLIDVTKVNDGLGLADGGTISTAQDIAKFVNGLFVSKSLLSDTSLTSMKDFQGDDHYGLGLYKDDVDGQTGWTHDGSSAGFSGEYYYFPDSDLILVLLTNLKSSDILVEVPEKVLQALK